MEIITFDLYEIKIRPAGSVFGLGPNDSLDVYLRDNLNTSWRGANEPDMVTLTMVFVDKVKETPKNYRLWKKRVIVKMYLDDKRIEVDEYPYGSFKGDLYDKDFFQDRNTINNLSQLKRNFKEFSTDLFRAGVKQEDIDLKTLASIVKVFYWKNSAYNSDYDEVLSISQEELFKRAYKELQKTEEKYKKVNDKVKSQEKDLLSWLQNEILKYVKQYTNADLSTFND